MKSEVIYKNEEADGKKIRILHFNDVYNIQNPNGNGGSSRFIAAIEEVIKDEPTLVLFSGDALSPSLLSSIVKGKQMIEILNLCHISAACVGNHEFDFGVETMSNLVKESNFPWLLSNVFDVSTGRPLGDVETHTILDYQGLKIGVIGIVEQEWLSTLSTVDYDDVNYEKSVIAGKRLAQKLKKEDKVDIVIALTHMLRSNDELFVEATPEIDIVLGGHDHDYSVKQIGNRWLVKSGVDFKEFTVIDLMLKDKKTSISLLEKFIVEPNLPENESAKKIVDKYMGELEHNFNVVIGKINVDLDGTFTSVRTGETNLGNFICDIIMKSADIDCCIINGGILRSDKIHPKGEFTLRDLKDILPFEISPVVLELTGDQIRRALENGVSEFPGLDGRFPQVSGIHFTFDPTKPKDSRIDPSLIKIQDELLVLDKKYKVGINTYLEHGKDGYEVFKEGRVLVEHENFPLLFNLVENHFKAVDKVKSDSKARLRASLVSLRFMHRICEKLSNDPIIFKEHLKTKHDTHRISFRTAALLICKTIRLQRMVMTRKDKKLIKQSSKFKEIIEKHEKTALELSPVIEGRIICLRSSTD